MSAKTILIRYLIRRKAELPLDPSELRKHLASVAERDRLMVTEEELDELAGTTETGDRKPDARKQAKQARNSRRGSKSGDNIKK
jgi:hypothetical protein